MNVRYFRTQFVKESEISAEQASGRDHFVGVYDGATLKEYRRVAADGKIVNTIVFDRQKRSMYARIVDGTGQLESCYYDFETPESSWFEATRVIFDRDGNVKYPGKDRPIVRGWGVVLPSVMLTPDMHVASTLKPFSGREVQLYMPKVDEMLRIDVRMVEEYLERYSVVPVVAHGPDVDVFHHDFLPAMAWIRKLRIRTITLHPSRGNYAQGAEAWKKRDGRIREMGVDIAYENLDANDRWINGIAEIAALDHPNVSLTLDVSHVRPGEDILALDEAVKEKIHVIHLSNRHGRRKHLPYRQGELPADAFIRQMTAGGYACPVILEYGKEHDAEREADGTHITHVFEAAQRIQ